MEPAISTFPPLSGFTKPLNGWREEELESPYFPICLSVRRELGLIIKTARLETRYWTNVALPLAQPSEKLLALFVCSSPGSCFPSALRTEQENQGFLYPLIIPHLLSADPSCYSVA